MRQNLLFISNGLDKTRTELEAPLAYHVQCELPNHSATELCLCVRAIKTVSYVVK